MGAQCPLPATLPVCQLPGPDGQGLGHRLSLDCHLAAPAGWLHSRHRPHRGGDLHPALRLGPEPECPLSYAVPGRGVCDAVPRRQQRRQQHQPGVPPGQCAYQGRSGGGTAAAQHPVGPFPREGGRADPGQREQLPDSGSPGRRAHAAGARAQHYLPHRPRPAAGQEGLHPANPAPQSSGRRQIDSVGQGRRLLPARRRGSAGA